MSPHVSLQEFGSKEFCSSLPCSWREEENGKHTTSPTKVRRTIRDIVSWFLRKKRSESSVSVVPPNLMALKIIRKHEY